jgi:hypothetical protein
MMRLLVIALLIYAAWFGWTRHDRWRERGSDELVFRNRTGQTLERMRVHVADEGWAIERLAPDTTVKLPVRCDKDGSFQLEWRVQGRDGEKQWQGGDFTHGPIRMRHRFELLSNDGVVWSEERLPQAPSRNAKKPR